MLATAHVRNVDDPETVEPATPTDPATTPWPGADAVMQTGLVAVFRLASAVPTCPGETAQLTLPTVSLGTRHGVDMDPVSRLHACGS